jgi:hypothetical protein
MGVSMIVSISEFYNNATALANFRHARGRASVVLASQPRLRIGDKAHFSEWSWAVRVYCLAFR